MVLYLRQVLKENTVQTILLFYLFCFWLCRWLLEAKHEVHLTFFFFHKLHFWVLSTPSPQLHPDRASVENFSVGMFETQNYFVFCQLREEFHTGDVFSLRHDTFNDSSSFLDRLEYAYPTSFWLAASKHKSELWFVVTFCDCVIWASMSGFSQVK